MLINRRTSINAKYRTTQASARRRNRSPRNPTQRGNTMHFVRGLILSLHIFGVIFWMGGLLMITSLLARVPEEVGLPKERFLGAARALFESAINLGAAVSIILGLVLILMDPSVLRQGWLHAKL